MGTQRMGGSEVTLRVVVAKINAARAGIERLDSDVAAFCNAQQQHIVHEFRADSAEHVWVFRGPIPEAPVDWWVKAGEIAHNLRSALGHMAWQMFLANGQAPTGTLDFPLFRDRARHVQLKRKPLWQASPSAQSVVERFQPFQPTGDGYYLWLLNVINNTDKHRHGFLETFWSTAGIWDPPIGPEPRPGVTGIESGVFQPSGELLVLKNVQDADVDEVEFDIRVEFQDTDHEINRPASGSWLKAELESIDQYGPTSEFVPTLSLCLDQVENLIATLRTVWLEDTRRLGYRW